ncbi:MAG: hypothetical protein H6829_09585 [Planctomycetes bacterium]|nr:hypothetical protein [Planctomycetota bacterium]MCB9912628.1 hypothetical protein [Planctomycetota bacterium]HRV80244.1 hypothetical protein [Planctomycetota bacterium]
MKNSKDTKPNRDSMQLKEAQTHDLQARFEAELVKTQWAFPTECTRVGWKVKYHNPTTQAAWLYYQLGFLDGVECVTLTKEDSEA